MTEIRKGKRLLSLLLAVLLLGAMGAGAFAEEAQPASEEIGETLPAANEAIGAEGGEPAPARGGGSGNILRRKDT